MSIKKDGYNCYNWTIPYLNPQLSTLANWFAISYDISTGNLIAMPAEGDYIATSSDNGTSWTITATNNLTYGGVSVQNMAISQSGLLINNTYDGIMAMRTDGTIYTSNNGIDWVMRASLDTARAITFTTIASKLYYVLSRNGGGFCSPNGSTWSIFGQVLEDKNWMSVTYGNNKFVALSINGDTAYSTDGEEWTLSELTLGAHSWQDVVYDYNKDMFIALSYTGNIAISKDGITWSSPIKLSMLGDRRWRSISYYNNNIIALSNKGYISTTTGDSTITYGKEETERNIRTLGEIVHSTIPLKDANLHLADGSVLSGNGVYSDFVAYMANKYTNNPRVINANISGNPTNNNGIISNFSTQNYITSIQNFSPSVYPWVIDIKLTTGSDVTTTQCIIAGTDNDVGFGDLCLKNSQFLFTLSSDGKWDTDGMILNQATGSLTVQPNTTYYLKIGYGLRDYFLSYSFDGNNYTTDISVSKWSNLTRRISPNSQLQDIASSTHIFLAIDSSGYIYKSSDGVTWTNIAYVASASSITWNTIENYGNKRFIALSSNGYISISEDNGSTWSTAYNSNLNDLNWQSIAWGNGKLVALSYSGYVSTSTDGVTWTPAEFNTTLGSNQWESVVYGNGKFIALSNDGRTSTSTDGTTWTSLNYNANIYQQDSWSNMTFGNGKFVIIGYSGLIGVSDDGINWAVGIPVSGYTGFMCVGYGSRMVGSGISSYEEGIFIISTNNGMVSESKMETIYQNSKILIGIDFTTSLSAPKYQLPFLGSIDLNYFGVAIYKGEGMDWNIYVPEGFTTELDWQEEVKNSINNTCGKYVYDSTNNILRLPKLNGIQQGTIDESSTGSFTAAGLPELVIASDGAHSHGYTIGNESAHTHDRGTWEISGKFEGGKSGASHTALFSFADGADAYKSGTADMYTISFNANASNGQYWTGRTGGGSNHNHTLTLGVAGNHRHEFTDNYSILNKTNTVQPETIKVLTYIVISTHNENFVINNTSTITSNLNNKLNNDLSNIVLNSTLKNNFRGLGLPSDRFIDLAVGSCGNTYIAPADGYFVVQIQCTTSGSDVVYFELNQNNNKMRMCAQITGVNGAYQGSGCAFLPVRKGDVINSYYSSVYDGTNIVQSSALKIIFFKFVYAENSV